MDSIQQLRDPSKIITVGVGLKGESSQEIKESLLELEELVETAGGSVVGSTTQVLIKYQPGTLIGSGKIAEIKEMILISGAGLVVFDHTLTGVQQRNIETELEVRVLDRSQIILDIFAQRAQTYEGKLQVELAQMLDQLPRMVHAWRGSLSRLGGGIGTRGPGETALELDRRRIRARVQQIRRKLDIVRKNRKQYRALRQKQGVPSFALIGYTNAGKSTLLNQLCQSDAKTKDQLFVTLDPLTRKIHLPTAPDAVVTDTVGFIRKLPHHLIDAFKATLEESGAADILLHVIDLSNPQMQVQIEIVEKLIKEFGWHSKPILYVFNKVDQAEIKKRFSLDKHPRALVSALTGEGIENLKKMMEETLFNLKKEFTLFFPRGDENRIYELSRQTQIIRQETASSGTLCYVHLTPALLNIWKDFLA